MHVTKTDARAPAARLQHVLLVLQHPVVMEIHVRARLVYLGIKHVSGCASAAGSAAAARCRRRRAAPLRLSARGRV